MSLVIIKLISCLSILFVLFFSIIAQINILSVINQENKILLRDKVFLESQREVFIQENTTALVQEIDKKLSNGDIQPISIGENLRQEKLETLIKQQQKQFPQISNIIVTR